MDFEELYAKEFPVVYKYLFSLCGDAALTEELTQETFYRAIQSSDTFRGTCKLSVWLCQIGKNCYFSQLRRGQRRRSVPLEQLEQVGGHDPEEDVMRRETAMALHRRLHALSEPYKEVFSLRTLGELSFAQIGDLFEKSESWARVTYHRAKLKLKEDAP